MVTTVLDKEIENNYKHFLEDWQDELTSSTKDIVKKTKTFQDSYKRLTTLQAWRAYILETNISEDSFAFFLEAQNDALLSHVQASIGCWRMALKSLRSCIENSTLALYYMDHPVELALWSNGNFRISFRETISYLTKHPSISSLPKNSESITGIPLLVNEYDKLSQAVHASSRDFRMTDEGKAIAFWSSDAKRVGIWSTHEKRTIEGINLLFLNMFTKYLTGAKQSNLRTSLSFSIPKTKDAKIKSTLKVTIKRR